MRTATPAGDAATRSADLVLIDRARPVRDMGDVRAALEELASDLRSLWSLALGRGDFDEITRVVEANHAVHLAVIALRVDTVIPAR